MKLKIWEIALITALLVTFSSGVYLNREEEELSSKLIRLHVVANSDTEEDQSLKLKVRDRVLEYLTPELNAISDRDDARNKLNELLSQLAACAEKEIENNGYGYDVKISLTEEYFPTTEYDSFSLPAGNYLSLRIIIGEGAGHNWWCVVFPPLCSSAELDTDLAAAVGLTDGEISLITTGNSGYRVKFRSIEILSELKKIIMEHI